MSVRQRTREEEEEVRRGGGGSRSVGVRENFYLLQVFLRLPLRCCYLLQEDLGASVVLEALGSLPSPAVGGGEGEVEEIGVKQSESCSSHTHIRLAGISCVPDAETGSRLGGHGWNSEGGLRN